MLNPYSELLLSNFNNKGREKRPLFKFIKMRKFIIFTISIATAISLNAQTNTLFNYNIENDTIWDSDTLLINDNVFIGDSATLTIYPGTIIEFQGYYKIEVNGILSALGKKYDSIHFTINDTTGFSDTATVNGGWGGIRFMERENNDTSYFNYCSFSYVKLLCLATGDGKTKITTVVLFMPLVIRIL